MIRINLAKKKTSELAAEGAAKKFKLPSKEELKELPLVSMGITTFLCFALYTGADWYKARELDLKEAEIQVLRDEQARLQNEKKQFLELEKLKAEVEKNDKLLSTKINALKVLQEGRRNSSKLLRDISDATPGDVWITQTTVNRDVVSITGSSYKEDQIPD